MEPPVKKLNVDTPCKENVEGVEEQGQQTVQNILTYDVLRIIFKYLSIKDLVKVGSICRSWRDAANNEAVTRQAPECIFKNFQLDNQEDSIECYNAKSLGNDLRIRPSLGIICEKVQEKDEWTPKGCYCENLPLECTAVVLGGYDIVSDNTQIEDDKLGQAVCAFLPKIPKLNHKIFHVDKYTFRGVSDIDINAHAEKLIRQMLPSRNEKSKCIIMLSNKEGNKIYFARFITNILQKRYKPGTLSVWGGVCVDLKLCDGSNSTRTCSKVARWTAITLSSPSLQSWSTVILPTCRTEAQIKAKLESFKEQVHLKKHSLGLMFACCERIYKKEMEISVFKKVFPTVPLIGLHGEGEYGLNTLNDKRENQLQHTVSTIFLILTYQ